MASIAVSAPGTTPIAPSTTQHIHDLYGEQDAASAAQHAAICGDQTARQAWREAVSEIAAKAHDKWPECNGRVDSAMKLVLAGDVELLADGTARIASQSHGETVYHVVNGHCTCKDFVKVPHHFCKHRLSAAIAKRANALLDASLNAQPV
jgi:hypothetical protein